MKLLYSILLISALSFCAFGQRNECFPFEKLAPEMRKKADELLLKMLDAEGLYTVIGDLKPMSSGFASFQFPIRVPKDDKQKIEREKTLQSIVETREILAHFRCGDEIFSDLEHFAKSFEGKRFAEAVIFKRSNLRKMLRERADFFARWTITENSHPLQVLYAVEYDETGARFGGYGYLFGYPDYAVNFFVQSSAGEEFTGRFVERDFLSLPTFSSPTNRFVYAVPKGHIPNEADKALKANTEKIFNEYKIRREKYIGDGKKGVVEMLRDWFCDEKGACSPNNAKF